MTFFKAFKASIRANPEDSKNQPSYMGERVCMGAISAESALAVVRQVALSAGILA